ncbi:MAG: hypothetical protein S4CHLAM45_04060 [Chlamydiales bacterium]|nr:hypothetical protein [Chlamydiales bacterium]MCH9619260.1 hypothetical protein [Chlamydiales bacterium]MCH9622522.1 hypothetical protein [Chlamydiales bacterium]
MFSFHSFAHYCFCESGHPFSYHVACQEAIEKLGGKFHAYTHEECSISPLPLGWTKWFPSISDQKKKKKFARRCRQIFKRHDKHRIFFLESFGRRDLRIFIFSALFFGRKKDAIWILFRDDHIWKRGRDRFQVRLFYKLLRLKFGKRVQFLSDSNAIASFLGEKLNHTFHVMPLPHIDFAPLPFQKPTTFTCCFLGEPRKEKGIHQILRLIKSHEPEALQFKIILSEGINIENSILPIEQHPKSLSREAYIKTLEQSDFILLPYSSYRYRRRTSGIFVEAIWMGKIPLVQEKTWLADELLKFDLGELIIDWNDPHFFRNLLKLSQSPELYKKLSQMQKMYTTCHAFDAFTKKIDQLIQY